MNPVQRLLVEGETDIHVVANLAIVKGLSNPKGYETKKKFEQQFSIIGDGKYGLKERIPTVLKTEGLTNFGIILDADANAQSTWESVKNILQQAGYNGLPSTRPANGIIEITGKPKIGIWIMPDNQNQGYLEDFLKQLVPIGDLLLPKANRIVQDLIDNELNRFTVIKRTKAEMYTWLAWQEKPELPFGTSIATQQVFDLNALLADTFLTWLQTIFEFEPPNPVSQIPNHA